MNRDIAIIKLTIISTIRSYSFISITLLSCIFAFFIPLTVFSGGGLVDLFQIRIDYSLEICSILIFISSVWSGCSIMAEDIELYKIHMLVVKPISKLRIWLNRFLGVFIIHLLFLMLISFIIFLMLHIMSNKGSLSSREKIEIKEKVFTGRKSYTSQLSGLNEEYSGELNARIKNTTLSESEKIEMGKKVMYTIISRRGEVKPGESKTFLFNVVKTNYSNNSNFKFMLYIGSPDMLERQNRPKAEGIWLLQVNNERGVSLGEKPETFISNNKYEMSISLKNLSEGENVIKLTYQNLDKDRSVFFRVTEFPQVQIKSANFIENYLRCLLIMALGIALLSAIGCALGCVFSFPVAVFVMAAYLLFGSLGNFILSGNEIFLKNDDIQLKIGYSLSKSFLKVITPIQKFQLSEYISTGMLIDNGTIMETIRKYFLIQFLAISVIGIYVFYRRELGMVAKR